MIFVVYDVQDLTNALRVDAYNEKMRAGSELSGPGYVVSVDLRSFNTINNAFGTAKGDELLYAMATVLKGRAESGELAAHVSCDSFVMFLHAADRDDLVRRRVQRFAERTGKMLTSGAVLPGWGGLLFRRTIFESKLAKGHETPLLRKRQTAL